MAGKRVLIVTTSCGRMGATGHPTGVWLEELATPYYALLDGGAEVTLASVAGGRIPLDPRSIPARAGQSSGEEPPAEQELPASVHRFLNDPQAMAMAENSPAVDRIDATPFDAILLPGGATTARSSKGARSMGSPTSRSAALAWPRSYRSSSRTACARWAAGSRTVRTGSLMPCATAT